MATNVEVAMLSACKIGAEVAYWTSLATQLEKTAGSNPREVAFYSAVAAFLNGFGSWYTDEDVPTEPNAYRASYETYRAAFHEYVRAKDWDTPFMWPVTTMDGRMDEKERDAYVATKLGEAMGKIKTLISSSSPTKQ
jgi:hypothetical protein